MWIKQLPAGAFTKLSTDVADANRPVWTPDGRFVAFLGIRDSRRTAWIRRADGSDQTRPVAPGMPEVDEILTTRTADTYYSGPAAPDRAADT